MDSIKAFKPDKATFYQPIKEEMTLAEKWAHDCALGGREKFNAKERVFLAWCNLRSDDAGDRARVMGADAFARGFERSIRDAQVAIDTVIQRFLADKATVIDPIDEIASCDDPWDLAEMVLEDRTKRVLHERTPVGSEYPIALGREHRAEMERIEVLRKIAIASQLFALSVIDPMADVSRDLTIVNRLVGERLFTNDDLIRVQINCVLQETDGLLHPQYPITFNASEKRLIKGAIERSVQYTCRIVPDEQSGRVYVVQSTSRPKEEYSTIIKLARRPVLDRRGLRHLVVAVRDAGAWRVATWEDVEEYTRIARERLWIHELTEEEDGSPPNPDSSKSYKAMKIMGRLVRQSRRGARSLVAPSVEHQIIPLETDLAHRFAKDGTSHEDYRRRQIMGYIQNEWFGWHMNNGLTR